MIDAIYVTESAYNVRRHTYDCDEQGMPVACTCYYN